MEALELISNKETKTVKQMSGAQAVVHSLIAEDVDLIFGYPGGAIMPVYDLSLIHISEPTRPY